MTLEKLDGEKTTAARPEYEMPLAVSAAISFGVLWFCIMAFCQGGWSKVGAALFVLWLVLSAIALAVGLTLEAMKKPIAVVSAVMSFATVGWFFITGSYRIGSTVAWDIAGIVLGATVVFESVQVLRARLPRWLKPTSAQTADDITTISALIGGWAGLTIVTLLRVDPLPADPSRFDRLDAELSIVAADAKRWQEVRVGLALSGGGFRAAVMHAGVLSALETLGVRVRTLSTVSGGSIIGSYYAIGGDPVAFKDAVATGRFNLTRELLLFHNAVRLPFPLTVPGAEVELFPWYRFNRRDVQASLLERTLYADRESWRAPGARQPSLIMATTDLTFGLLVGMLPDGLLTLTPAPDSEAAAYRGGAVRFSKELTLSERVAISGAFPVAFPPERVGAKVTLPGSAGRGERPLLLADGGIADNSGLELLVAADQKVCRPPGCAAPDIEARHGLDARFASDVFMLSDGGAIFGVEQKIGELATLNRAFDVSTARIGSRYSGPPEKQPVRFSAQDSYLNAGTQFRAYEDSAKPDDLERSWEISLDPRSGYPDAVLSAIIETLPEADRPRAGNALKRYIATRGAGPAVNPKDWREALFGITDAKKCVDSLPGPPGLCAAAELRLAIQSAARNALQAFRATSTLDDQLPEERVDSLYRLGRFLVYVRWPEVRQAMDRAPASAAAPAVAPDRP